MFFFYCFGSFCSSSSSSSLSLLSSSDIIIITVVVVVWLLPVVPTQEKIKGNEGYTFVFTWWKLRILLFSIPFLLQDDEEDTIQSKTEVTLAVHSGVNCTSWFTSQDIALYCFSLSFDYLLVTQFVIFISRV